MISRQKSLGLALVAVLAAVSIGILIRTAGAAGQFTPTAHSENALVATRASAFAAACPHQITQSFPTAGPAETTWVICWREVRGFDSLRDPNGLVIGPVYFQKSATAPMLMILNEMRVSDYFVPYHSGSPRFYDLSGFNFVLTRVTAADCPASAGGAPISHHVCKEVRDRGLDWKDYGGVRRGEELVLWGAIDSANYRYIQEYTFRDDGVIIGRMGATGQNLPGDELETHAHNAIWRIDMDLGGDINTVAHLTHTETIPDRRATDSATQLTTAQGFTYNVRTHDALQIANPAIQNAQGRTITYQLMPLVTGGGLTQHREEFTQNDFWVTPYDPNQYAARRLPRYVAGSPSLTNQDIVVWFKASLHHMPRTEDGVYKNDFSWVGTAHVMWTGFMLMPHDLFDCSPFYRHCPK